MRGHVTTVVALACHALIARYFLAESVFTAHEEEEHCWCLRRLWTVSNVCDIYVVRGYLVECDVVC